MITNEGKYLVDDSGRYLFVAPFEAIGFSWFFGRASGSRPAVADFSTLTEVEDPTYSLTDPLTITFDSGVGWQIFAEPVAAVTRGKWEAGLNNAGEIGGAVSRRGNLWPDPILQQYDGLWYKVYITNWRTEFFVPVTVT
jgi:hypothetical protein